MAQIKVEEVVVPTPKKYVLTLSEEEAATLAAVASHVGGDPYSSPRKYMDHISTALKSVGVNPFKHETLAKKYHLLTRIEASINFSNFDESE